MKRTIILSVAVLLTTLGVCSIAEAQQRYWPRVMARDSVPQQRVKPLQLVEVDTTQLVDFFIDRMRQRVQWMLPKGGLRPIVAKPLPRSMWHEVWQAWSYRVHDSINLVGGLGDAERDVAVFSAAQTVAQGVQAYLHSGQAEVYDAIELALYNGVASGVYGQASDTAAVTAGYWALQAQNLLMATDGDSTLYINLYAMTDGTFDIAGRKVWLFVDTSMPWAGLCKISLQVLEGNPKMRLALRLPLWARGMAYNKAFTIRSGQTLATVTHKDLMQMDMREDGYIVIDRDWREDTQIVIDLAMPVQYWSVTSPQGASFVPQVLRRGPLTYAFWRPQGKYYFSDRTPIRWQFDLDHYDAFALITTLHSTPPDPKLREQGDTACYLIPYHAILKDHTLPLQLWTHEGSRPAQ